MWETIILLIVKAVLWWLDSIGASKATKELFFEFIKQAANDTKSVKLRDWGEAQLKELHETPWEETE